MGSFDVGSTVVGIGMIELLSLSLNKATSSFSCASSESDWSSHGTCDASSLDKSSSSVWLSIFSISS